MSIRIEDDAVLVITDTEFGAVFTGTPNLNLNKRVVLLTVRDDATMEERAMMAQKAADIVRARSGEEAT